LDSKPQSEITEPWPWWNGKTAVAGRMAQRIEEGSLPPLAWWDDVTTFDGKPWRGVVHIVSAGFPCQPFSVAGKRKGKDDERWIWPDIG
jgi:DNA (cytosine-5)-methyltransferase 1